MKTYNRQAVFFFLLFCLLISQYVFADNKQAIPFMVITDIHFDPFISCGNKQPCPLISKLMDTAPEKWPLILSQYEKDFSKPGQDTNWPLLVSSLRIASKQASIDKIQFILLLGDFLGHEYHRKFREYAKEHDANAYQIFTRKTLQFLSYMLATSFPNINMYPAVGNNDSYHGDYYVAPNGPFFEDTAKTWAMFIKDNTNKKIFKDEMRYAGFYALPLRDNVKLIMLNSTLFSEQVKGPQNVEAAFKELEWFKAELKQAKVAKQKVIIAMHIPTRLDFYVGPKWRLFTVLSLWQSRYIEAFDEQIEGNADNIVGIFAGHLHSNWYQILSFNDNSKVPFNVTASISPIFGNNPSFALYNYSSDFMQLQDYQNFYLTFSPNPRWRVEKGCSSCL